MKRPGNTFFLLAFIFFLSVAVRLPNLNRPLSKHHEFCTAIALRVMQVWEEGGIQNYGFNPAMNYANPADKHINNFASATGKMVDEAGNYYYVSHPPLAYYVPYFVFQIPGIDPSVPAIQIFHLLVHFLCGVMVYLIISFVFGVPGFQLFLPSVIGYLIYMFSPATLWFQSNTYMADMFVQLFFIAGVYVVLRLLDSWKHYWLLGAVVFLMIYTSWLGVFFAFSLILFCLWRLRNQTGFRIITATTIGSVTAICLIVFQYSQINGWEAYYSEALSRFSVRGGISALGLKALFTITKNYLTGFLPVLGLIVLLLGFDFNHKLKDQVKNKQLLKFAFLSVVPVVLLHIVLTNYSGHDFTALYGALFLSVFAGALSKRFMEKLGVGKTAIAFTVFLALSVAQYYYINRPGEYSISGDRYAELMNIGFFIKDNSEINEVIFIKGMKPAPEIILYAHRNILLVENENEAIDFLKRTGSRKGLIFKINNAHSIQIESRITL